jgi:hypothetical protein
VPERTRGATRAACRDSIVRRDLDGPGFEINLGPEDCEGFADAYAGAEHQCDQVWKVGMDGAFVGGELLSKEGNFFAGQGSGWVLGLSFDGSTSARDSCAVGRDVSSTDPVVSEVLRVL